MSMHTIFLPMDRISPSTEEKDCKDGHCRQCGTCCIVFPARIPDKQEPDSPSTLKPSGEVCKHLQINVSGKCACLLQDKKDKWKTLDPCKYWNGCNMHGIAYNNLMLHTVDWICNPTSPEQVELIRKHIARGGLPLEIPNWLVSFQEADQTFKQKTFARYLCLCDQVPQEILELFNDVIEPSAHEFSHSPESEWQ